MGAVLAIDAALQAPIHRPNGCISPTYSTLPVVGYFSDTPELAGTISIDVHDISALWLDCQLEEAPPRCSYRRYTTGRAVPQQCVLTTSQDDVSPLITSFPGEVQRQIYICTIPNPNFTFTHKRCDIG